MKKDLVIGIVGTVILVTAMVGVFKYEASRGGGGSFLVTWSESSVAGPSANDVTRVGVTTPKEIAVNASNLTKVGFVLSWTDDVGAPDEFSLTVTSPTGENRSVEGATGSLTVLFEGLAPLPGEMRLLAANPDDAEARIARDATTTAGQGVWGVAVRLVRAPGLQAPAGGVEVQPDGQNAWALATMLTTFKPAFEQE